MILTIAGFDPSSGAGVTADLKTIAAHGAYGIACITALTVQSTQAVRLIQPLSPDLVSQTLSELAIDFEIAAIRVGMLGDSATANAVADFLQRLQSPLVVLDPVLASSSGTVLLNPAGVEILKARLLPLSFVVTPNLPEAIALSGSSEPLAAARELQRLGARNVIITGGHSESNADLLLLASGENHLISGARIESNSTHGTGCAYASALACNLTAGKDMLAASTEAKRYVKEAIAAAEDFGHGKGPLNHFYRMGRL